MTTHSHSIGACLLLLLLTICRGTVAAQPDVFTPEGGHLEAIDEQGATVGPCPLAHTDVDISVSGHFSRVTVTQRYHNPYQNKIEAVYTFPLSHRAAVDRMVMTIGDRVVEAEVKERGQAQAIYQAARAKGYVTSLLEQERPNIFTQSVANIEPGAEILVELSYVEILCSADGVWTLAFPLVVGPRYVPGRTTKGPARGPAELGTGFAPDTDQVPDASRITPMPVRPGTRAGHEVSIAVRIDTGGPTLLDLASALHEIGEDRDDAPSRVSVSLKQQSVIPNRDFVLTWRLEAESIKEAQLVHAGEHGSFFTLVLRPPDRVEERTVGPRELIFVMDTSGSMHGLPIEKSKEVITRALDAMRPDDTFNLITFAGRTDILWEQPRAATADNRAAARRSWKVSGAEGARR